MTGKYPRLRSHTRKRANGKVVTYWFYDMRHTGEPDTPLGTDYAAAVKKWDEIHNHRPRIAGTLKEAMERWEAEVLPGYDNEGTKRTYRQNLRAMEGFFGPMAWETVTFPLLKGYLKKRTAKTQGNRELSLLQIIWNWARGDAELAQHGIPPWPAAGMEKARWKNKEQARKFEVTDAMFAAVYECADQTLRDAMDLATATGMRLTDCRTVLLPSGPSISISASKTGKAATFDVPSSPVLTALVERRRATKANHLMLLSTPDGRKVTPTMLRDRWDAAREEAASKPENAALADELRRMFLRDMRKRAADLAEDLEGASRLLQHSSTKVTADHYRTKATKLTPVR